MKKYKMPDSICDNPKQQIGYWFENGVQLSGGQWQRLAICRTMARDNEILLLDEPNAALDAITFRMLYNEINAQANRKVCVMLLQHFVNFIGGNEEICVFDDGKLISRGKHDRLYDTCNYTKNRKAQGGTISEITIHHCASILTIEALGALWHREGRKGSSHYGVSETNIGQYVHESDVAWTNGNWEANCRAVTIETSTI